MLESLLEEKLKKEVRMFPTLYREIWVGMIWCSEDLTFNGIYAHVGYSALPSLDSFKSIKQNLRMKYGSYALRTLRRFPP